MNHEQGLNPKPPCSKLAHLSHHPAPFEHALLTEYSHSKGNLSTTIPQTSDEEKILEEFGITVEGDEPVSVMARFVQYIRSSSSYYHDGKASKGKNFMAKDQHPNIFLDPRDLFVKHDTQCKGKRFI